MSSMMWGKPPEVFPSHFHRILQNGGDQAILQMGESKEVLENVADNFRAFRKSLRDNPEHYLAEVENTHSLKTRLERVDGKWVLWLRIAPLRGYLEDLAGGLKTLKGE
jgi:hypothetical protein